MGILNVTNESFYSGCRSFSPKQIARRTEQIVSEGGAIIDIGACSTRPGSKPVTAKTELQRLIKAVTIVKELAPTIPISIDTYRAEVAEVMLRDFAVDIINDISSGEMDEHMFDVLARYNAPYILTHIQGTPTSMQQNPVYEDVVGEVCDFFTARVATLHRLGVTDIILDPGFGFGKTVEHNYTLLRNLRTFESLNLPILVGVSRKSMITKPLGITPREALAGTQALDTLALVHGASILRVHDVLPAVHAVKLFEIYQQHPIW